MCYILLCDLLLSGWMLDVERIIALKRSHEAKQKHLIHPGTSHVKVSVSRNLY